jgi:hypothetical protein
MTLTRNILMRRLNARSLYKRSAVAHAMISSPDKARRRALIDASELANQLANSLASG